MSNNGNDSHVEAFVPKINQFAQEYIDALTKEQKRLSADFPLCAELITDVIDRIYATGRTPGKELKADVFKQKPIKLSQSVYLPVKQYPKFNFQGKILGPKGNTLKRLHQETLCSIAIKGRHSMRDQEREELLRKSGDPAYNHLHKSLFIEIATVAPPAEAYARIAYALSEIRKYIIPDKNDEVSQEQYRELMEINPEFAAKASHVKNISQKSVFNKLTAMGGPKGFASEQDGDIRPTTPYNSFKNYGNTYDKPLKMTEQSSVAVKNRNFRTQPYARNTPQNPRMEL